MGREDLPRVATPRREGTAMSESERIASIRRGTRKTERQLQRYTRLLQRALVTLDELADEIEEALERKEQ